MIESIRISVRNGSASRHFWETALGLHFVAETEVYDAGLRRVWGVPEGYVRLTRLEVAPEVFPKIELFEWEYCSERPIRDRRHPWDLGLLAVRIPVSNLEQRLKQMTQFRCPAFRNPGEQEATIFTPDGERVILRQGGSAAIIAVVKSIADASPFFRKTLHSPNGVPPRSESSFIGAASVDSVRSLKLGCVELVELARSADPRPSIQTGQRMHPKFTGYWMLSAAIDALDHDANPVERPFTGRTFASLAQAPGGIPVEIFEPSPR